MFIIYHQSLVIVCYEVGRKFEKKLFIIPNCLKNNFTRFQTSEIEPCLEISNFFLQKISETPKNFVFRDQLISMTKSYDLFFHSPFINNSKPSKEDL